MRLQYGNSKSLSLKAMEILSLDLTTQRCPLALLLTKRACAKLLSEQQLELRISDSGARSDIPRYLLNHGYMIDTVVNDNTQLVMLVKKGHVSTC
ncbi:sulfurtransferase TusA family protein [Photobacterium leiognathi]|uniref:sulfurtransferase TusA family protein n=1 Tax=Photobacterium leiognathi TaxID=553611 RepID=UPI003F74EB69